MEEGKIYTRGNSFRAKAELHARKYRSEVLGLVSYDNYGHILDEVDANNGLNFINPEILHSVKLRENAGKGIHFGRTSKNLLSSQAMCFNLFEPLNKDKRLLIGILNSLLKINVKEIIGEIQIEFTPPKEILNDQTGKTGVDCDAFIEYKTQDNLKGLLVIETKYVEKEFSNCGFKKSSQNDKCPNELILEELEQSCRYHTKKYYKYWNRTMESDIFDMTRILGGPCPFGGALWQLWTNSVLAYGLSDLKGYDQFYYVVIAPRENYALSQNNSIWDQFSQLLKKDTFRVLFIEDVITELLSIAPNSDWIKLFQRKYIVGSN